MFEKPTAEDFVAKIDWHISKALDRAGRSVAQVRADAPVAHIPYLVNPSTLCGLAARKEFDEGIKAVLGELNRTIRDTDLDRHVLRKKTEERLKKFAEDAKAAANASDLHGAHFGKQLADFDRHLDFALRQFDVGFSDPPEPEVRPVTKNIITVGNMTGSAIQQGSPNASQKVQCTLNIEAVRTALSNFETAISGANLPATTLDEIKADIHTIRAQLSKTSPTLLIIQETGRTMRNVIEGIAAGVLTPGVIAAAPALWSALGLG